MKSYSNFLPKNRRDSSPAVGFPKQITQNPHPHTVLSQFPSRVPVRPRTHAHKRSAPYGRLPWLTPFPSRTVGGWRSAPYGRLPWLTPSRWRDLRRTLGLPFGGHSRRRRGRPLVRACGSACARCPRAFVRLQAPVRFPSPVACAPSAPAWGADAPLLVCRGGLVAPRFLISGCAIPLGQIARVKIK